jgi:hypothetical protein
MKGRVVRQTEEVETKQDFVDVLKGWIDGWTDGWKDVISTTLCQGKFKIFIGPVKEIKQFPYTRLVLK